MCEHKWSKFPENKPRYLICTKCGEAKESITGLEKWKKEHIEKIERMDIEEAFIEIWWNDDECRWCKYKLDCEGDADEKSCTKGIKAYLDMEVE